MELNEATDLLYILNCNIKKVLRQTNNGYEAGAEILFPRTPDGRMYRDELSDILDKLVRVSNSLDYLQRSVSVEGRLEQNSYERYELQGVELTCGSAVEVLLYEGDHNDEVWTPTRIEHDGNDYYAVGDRKKQSLDGMPARLR